MVAKETIDRALDEIFRGPLFPAEPEGLYGPLEYMVSIGGKRLRPRLCLTAYSLFKSPEAQDDTSVFGPDARGAAKALELFHTFTLIHDDIMDRSPLRRGHETVWVKWDEDTAILSGDEMVNQSLLSLMDIPGERLRPAINLWLKTSSEVCRGQQYDMEFEQVPHVTMEKYLVMIGLKTSVLLGCSAKMGAIVAGAPEDVCDALYRYAYNLGLAFQIADDYLDVYGDPSVFGKPVGGDILNGKKSWMSVRAEEKEPGVLDKVFEMETGTPDGRKARIDAAMAVYDRLSLADEAREAILSFHSLALEGAEKAFSVETPEYKCLADIAHRLVGRTR